MRTLIHLAALVVAAATPAFAEDAAAPAGADMTCSEFLALEPAQQMQAMLTLRAAAKGEAAPAAAAEAPAAGDPKLTAMRTSCEGVPDAKAADALVAAHADQE